MTQIDANSMYDRHVEALQTRWEAALTATRLDAVVIAAGSPAYFYLDDMTAPFRPNPHFAQWLPGLDAAHSLILVRPGHRPRLYFHQPADYWHAPPVLPDGLDGFDVERFDSDDALLAALADAVGRVNHSAFVGEHPERYGNLPLSEHNPAQLVDRISFMRAYKTTFERRAIENATQIGVAGHRAAKVSFDAGGSEYDIHMAYLGASQQVDAELPYSNIVALNEHAGVLHYQHYDRQAPDERRSFLIDAGARSTGYACDITRTYSATKGDAFDGLIESLDQRQQSLIADIRPGLNYVDLHTRMHREVAELLAEFSLVSCSAEAAFENRITETFFPHGLGHLLGLQTHDVGGFASAPEGGRRAPPDQYPALRLTREIEVDQVFTVEPGVYFIPMLLDELRTSPNAAVVNWFEVDAFLPCGGIRIEDNVVVTETGADNLTRTAFAELSEA